MLQPIRRSRNQYWFLPVSRCAPVGDLMDPFLPHDEDFRLAEFLDGVHGEGRGMAIAASPMENLSLWKQEECVLVSQFGSPLRALGSFDTITLLCHPILSRVAGFGGVSWARLLSGRAP